MAWQTLEIAATTLALSGIVSPPFAETLSRLRCTSARAPASVSFTIIGAAYFVSRRFDEAVPKLCFAIQEGPDYPPPYRYLAS
jgi:hypothetical protein